MKRLVALVLLVCLNSALWAQFRYRNPVLHADYSDPDVCRVGEDYWMTASSFHCFPGLPILHSTDLVNWQLVGAALDSYPDPLAPGEGVWAPAIRYHDGWFYIFVGDPDRGVFMLRTQDPRGRWEPPVWLVRERGMIDPCPLWDDDGKAYLSHALAGSRAGLKSIVCVAPMAPDGTRLLGPSRIVFDGHATQPTIEGTKFFKRNGYYYIFAPAGGVSTGWQTVLRSDSPFGPFEERIVMEAAEGTINGPHQGAWVDSPSGDWFLHFQDKGAYGRIVHLQPMQWRSDGWPVIGADPDGDGIGHPVDSWEAPFGTPNRIIPEPSATGSYGLSLDWQYPCVPRPFWHQALPGGDIRLFSVEQGPEYRNLWDCPNLLQQKFPAERFSVTARLVFRPNPQLKAKGEQAGLVVMGASYGGIRMTDTDEGVRVETVRCENAAEGAKEACTTLSVLPLDAGECMLWVKLEVRAKQTDGPVPDALCYFSYSFDGKTFTRAGEAFKAVPGRWIGAKWGFFCNRFSPKNDAGCLEIRDLDLMREFAPLEGFNYEEEKVPAYTLPDLLAGVKSVREWERKRRPALLQLFEREMYGAAPDLHPSAFRLIDSDAGALGGLATRSDLDNGVFRLRLYVPNGAEGPVPAFLGVNFFGNDSILGETAVGPAWPLEEVLSRGYAVATFSGEDIVTEHGQIAAWAWGLSRAMDYLESEGRIGSVAVFGHSRMGKAALWAAACDTRFALVISNQSGCGGAALSRHRFGETVRRINTHYPSWFAEAFHKYSDNEDRLPFDQHELLALIAPRPLCVASADNALWLDPRGEYLGLQGALPVYALYGREDVIDYFIRSGKHSMTEADWAHYLDFADRFLKK